MPKIFNISKRRRFVVSSVILTLIVGFATQTTLGLINNTYLLTYLIVTLLTYGLTYWSLKEDVHGIELLTLFIIPILFTIGTITFIHTLPTLKRYHYPLIAIYPIAMYVILLTNNIFNVAAIRTIQLLRAARAVAYLMTLVTTYFVTTSISAFQTNLTLKLIFFSLIIILITFQFFWSFDLGRGEGSKVKWYTITCTLLLSELILLLQLIPVGPALEGLTIITTLYCMLGLSTHYLERKLTPRIAAEYILIALVITSAIFLTLPWSG